VWAIGDNQYGDLGNNSTTPSTTPVQAAGLTGITIKAVAAGYYHTLAAKTDGTLWSWGYNFYSQLGNGATANRSAPAQVGTSAGWGKVFPSSYQTLATTSDGSLWAWGFANNGSLGYAWRNQFVPDLVLPALSPAQTITFPAVGNIPVGNTVTLAATGSSGLPASYIVSGPASLNGSALTVAGPGPITVIAYQPGDSYWQSSDIAFQNVNLLPAGITGVSATRLTTNSITLNATINPNGSVTTAKFQSGLTNAYGTDTPITLTPNNGVTGQTVSAVITGLIPGNTYHFRVTATSPGGTTTTADFTFNSVSIAYANWAAASGISGPNSGPAADFDGDGAPNLLEWGFGTNPAGADAGPLAVNGTTITAYGGPITITVPDGAGGVNHLAAFGRQKNYLSLGLTYTVQFTTDFSTWTTVTATPAVLADDGQIQIVTVPFPAQIDDGPAVFFRVGVSSP